MTARGLIIPHDIAYALVLVFIKLCQRVCRRVPRNPINLGPLSPHIFPVSGCTAFVKIAAKRTRQNYAKQGVLTFTLCLLPTYLLDVSAPCLATGQFLATAHSAPNASNNIRCVFGQISGVDLLLSRYPYFVDPLESFPGAFNASHLQEMYLLKPEQKSWQDMKQDHLSLQAPH